MLFNTTKKRQSIDFDADLFSKLKAYKDLHNYSSISALLNRMIDTFATLDPAVMDELPRHCRDERRRIVQQQIDSEDTMLQAQVTNALNQYTNLQLFFTSGKPLADKEEQDPSMRRIDLAKGKGYVIFPEDWVVLNENNAAYSSYAYVMETKNGSKYDMPHFLLFTEKETLEDDDCDWWTENIMQQDKHYREVLSQYIPLQKGSDGKYINVEESLASPVPGYFRIMDAGLPYCDYPMNAMVIREK